MKFTDFLHEAFKHVSGDAMNYSQRSVVKQMIDQGLPKAKSSGSTYVLKPLSDGRHEVTITTKYKAQSGQSKSEKITAVIESE